MLTIRLRRMGKRDQAFYRFVVSDSRKAPTASAVEEVGHYNPRVDPPEIRLDRERIDYWVGHGATLSNTVKTLVKRAEAQAEVQADEGEAEEKAEKKTAKKTEKKAEKAEAKAEADESAEENAEAEESTEDEGEKSA